MDDYKKIGIGLTGAGLLFMLLGVLMFFDKGLLAMGNILFLSGVVMIIGAKKTFKFFFQKRKAKGTACFLGGILLVLYGWAMIGIFVEGFGFLNLFGDFFPIALGFLRNMPIIGSILTLPVIRSFTDRFVTKARLPV
ncbi:hypothetical protein AB1Y20_013182 [Prymnesium parvum]|uniref:Vesicle transport protein n=1 Tax=Prymnesium parvum TaxID=97485 RepID=A0AB34IMF6_PRYPA|mmetsp:Transcript_31666/g.78904  ORF Transcript_31666/g.78904 Transcript_31666/m.78904 type:complete len:137 (+) Transcript_31666:45-455(+)